MEIDPIHFDPIHFSSFHELGAVLGKLRKTAAAIEMLETAVDLDPGSAKTRYILSQVYARQGNPEKANAALEQFRILSGQHPD